MRLPLYSEKSLENANKECVLSRIDVLAMVFGTNGVNKLNNNHIN